MYTQTHIDREHVWLSERERPLSPLQHVDLPADSIDTKRQSDKFSNEIMEIKLNNS